MVGVLCKRAVGIWCASALTKHACRWVQLGGALTKHACRWV